MVDLWRETHPQPETSRSGKTTTKTQNKIEQAGGKIVQATFSFPGGRRFHFADPNGNEYAVWSDK